ncbi:ParB N-terminal domain-containing protein [Microscilla marina]|uniref:ParB-like N-terminal domain-containing protein n=1 Tax=Microscilla marina ATCC 23134 TaxID=313606 RepID=A1ZVY6_MICM2|nr:ParB N-terminal domain-containing protein [Microscilla marina]EAY25468.1 hypothetical protein M23134_00822 [Microscilla marina ATCC 23134]
MGKLDKLKKIKPGGVADDAFSQVEKAKSKFKTTDDYIKSKIEVHPDFRDWIHPLSDEEYKQLQENIIEEGCREPLVVWQVPNAETYYIIDGHNRHRVCTSNNVHYNIVVKEFVDAAEAKEWMLLNQLGRRNLTKEQAAYYRGLIYNQRKSDPKKNLKRGNSPKSQNDTSGNIAEELSKQYNTSRAGILRDGKFAEGLDKVGSVDPVFKRQVLSGKAKVKKATVEKLAKTETNKIKEEVNKIKEAKPTPKATTSSLKKAAPKEAINVANVPQFLQETVNTHRKVVKANKQDEQYFKSLGALELCEQLLAKVDWK